MAVDVLCLHLCGLEAQRFCSTLCNAAWSAYSEVLDPKVKIRTLATWKPIRQLDGETVNLMQPDDVEQILLSFKFSNLLPVLGQSRLMGEIKEVKRKRKKEFERSGKIRFDRWPSPPSPAETTDHSHSHRTSRQLCQNKSTVCPGTHKPFPCRGSIKPTADVMARKITTAALLQRVDVA